MIGLAHFFDNEAGGSAHGMEKGGLTPFGREVVKKVQEKEDDPRPGRMPLLRWWTMLSTW